jgi:IS30 family transposase
MKNLNSKKQKHMTLEDRTEIQMGLQRGQRIKAIATTIGKDPTTISKDIKKHIHHKPIACNDDESEVVHMDGDGNIVDTPTCPLLLKSPYVCNGCDKSRKRCGFNKQFYYAKRAQNKYEEDLVDSRTGIALTKKSFYEMDQLVSDKIKKGQRLYHISQCNDLGVSQATMYRYVNKGYLSVTPFDFPRIVKFKQRKKSSQPPIPKALKKGRMYDDFKAFIQDSNITSWVEMDTVIGRIGGKAIMTFNFSFCNFLVGVLLEDKTALEVSNKANILKTRFKVSNVRFGDIIPLLLTDNGTEFANIWTFINDLTGNHETDLFFCDPNQSQQKARIEKNHTLFRDIVPKGESFDDFTQDTVNLIFSHVNSVKRKALNGKSAYELFCFTYGEKIADLFGITHVDAQDVIQSPKLLK